MALVARLKNRRISNMNKPNGYDEVQVGGDYTPIELGGHHLVIKGVREEKSKSGKDMIVVGI
jgi:hypothetical protein